MRGLVSGPAAPAATAVLAYHNLMAFPYRTGFTATALRTLLGRTGFRVDSVRGVGVLPGLNGDSRRWALLEERVVRTASRLLPATGAPWLEVTASNAP